MATNASVAATTTTISEDTCPDQVSNLIAGQHIDAGDVRISNDEANLYVELATRDGWLVTETHVFAGTGSLPVNRRGTPVPGRFPYKSAFSPGVDTATEVIPLADLGIACDDSLKVAVHAVVERTVGDVTEEETAWGDGERFNTPRWSYFTLYTGCCEPPPPDECVAAPVSHWTSVDPTTWPVDLSDWVFCWSEVSGGMSAAEIMAMEPTTFFVRFSQEYISAKLNAACLGVNCVVGPALSRTNYLTNDCVIDDDERALADSYEALYVSYNGGTYDPPIDVCW